MITPFIRKLHFPFFSHNLCSLQNSYNSPRSLPISSHFPQQNPVFPGKLGLDRDPLLDSTEHVETSEEATSSGTTSNQPSCSTSSATKPAGNAWQEVNRAPCEDDFDTIRVSQGKRRNCGWDNHGNLLLFLWLKFFSKFSIYE